MKETDNSCVIKNENAKNDLLFENRIWLTMKEAADYLRKSESALRTFVHRYDVPKYKLGRSVRFKKDDLDKLLEASKEGGL